jgi:hypothetical protein
MAKNYWLPQSIIGDESAGHITINVRRNNHYIHAVSYSVLNETTSVRLLIAWNAALLTQEHQEPLTEVSFFIDKVMQRNIGF